MSQHQQQSQPQHQPQSQPQPSSRKGLTSTVIIAVAATVLVLALGVIVWALVLRGSSDQGEGTETPLPQSSAPQSEPTQEATEEPGADAVETSEPTQQPEEVEPDGCVAPVAGAYPCAGGPIPEGARPLTKLHLEGDGTWATLQSPSENILCDVIGQDWYWGGYAMCTVHGWPYTINPNYEQDGGFPAVFLEAEGPAELAGKGDPMLSQLVEVSKSDTLPYGTVWYFEDFAFASEDNGLTVWNVKSGYGALLNREGMAPFGPS
mgnify:FL=1